MFDYYLERFHFVPFAEILAVANFNHSSFNKFKIGIRDRKIKESSIPDDDIFAAEYECVPGAYNYGIAFRKTSPAYSSMTNIATREFSRIYLGEMMKDFIVTRVEKQTDIPCTC